MDGGVITKITKYEEIAKWIYNLMASSKTARFVAQDEPDCDTPWEKLNKDNRKDWIEMARRLFEEKLTG